LKNIVLFPLVIVVGYSFYILSYYIGIDPKSIILYVLPFNFGIVLAYHKIKYPVPDAYSAEAKSIKILMFLTLLTSVLALLSLGTYFM